MKIQHIISILFVVCTLFSFSSCLDDDWFDDDWYEDGGWQDDRRVESIIRGRWFVDGFEEINGYCPYLVYDEFHFYGNGKLEIMGDRDFYERGSWSVEDGVIFVDLNSDSYADLVCQIRALGRNWLDLKVHDYFESSIYYITLGR